MPTRSPVCGKIKATFEIGQTFTPIGNGNSPEQRHRKFIYSFGLLYRRAHAIFNMFRQTRNKTERKKPRPMFQTNEHSSPVVYMTKQRHDTAQRAVSDTKTEPRANGKRKPLFGDFSMKFIAYTSAMVIIVLFLSVTITNLLLTKTYYQDSENNEFNQRLADKARTLESQLAFFQQIVDHVATQPTTQDILENKDDTSAQTWALQMRRFLPQAMGVALLSNSGEVMGAPADMQLGPQSLTDLAKLSQGEPIKMPPVHRLTASTSHFDLVAPVRDETGAPLGMVFVNFGLTTLQPLLQSNTNNGQKLVLRDGNNNAIAQHDRLGNPDEIRQQKTALANSDWQLSLTESAERPVLSFLSLAIFNISALLLTVGIIAFMVRYVLCALSTDFSQIKTLLNDLAKGESLTKKIDAPQLRETAEILPTINHIQRGLDKKQRLLKTRQLTDEITGLPNRRQFNHEFARAYDFARRGTPVCIVRLHVQGLNNFNSKQTTLLLTLLSKTLKAHVRKVDHIAHLDKDQFALLMFGMTADGATPCLERLHKSFFEQQMQHPKIPDTLSCRLFCGYTLIHPLRDNSAADVLNRTEQALADAQMSAKHCIIAA
ncbi:MAG TPA: diguanylate cyclase [Gammaproteobacteria bacterium]|nr:diguanylate cyclase [Gammaproteobacteria bacterium]